MLEEEYLMIPNSIDAKYERSDTVGMLNLPSFSNPIKSYVPTLRRGSAVPNWQQKIAARTDASSLYERRSFTTNSANYYVDYVGEVKGLYGYRFKGYTFNRHNVDITRLCYPEPSDVTTRDLALARLKRRINDRSKQFSLMVPLAEIGELRGTLKAIAYSTIDILKALIDIKRTKGKSASKYAAHAWLVWSFGLKPTLNDASELLASIDAFLMRTNGDMVRDKGSAYTEWFSDYSMGTTAGHGLTAKHHYSLQHQLTYRFVAGYIPALRSGNDYSIAEHLRLSPGALASVAWELTAFSWVFDYFTTMGAFLEDTFVSSSTPTVFVNAIKKYECKLVGSLRVDVVGGFSVFANTSGRGQQAFYKYYSRTPLGALPRRSLRFKTPSEITGVKGEITSLGDVQLAISRVLNLASILVGGKAYSNRID